MNIRLLSFAKRELIRIHRYYEKKSPGLGDSFLDDAGVTIRRIKQSPHMFQPFIDQLWRRQLTYFRFSVLYRIDGDEIVVLTVGHSARGPAFWRKAAKRS